MHAFALLTGTTLDLFDFDLSVSSPATLAATADDLPRLRRRAEEPGDGSPADERRWPAARPQDLQSPPRLVSPLCKKSLPSAINPFRLSTHLVVSGTVVSVS